MADINKTIFNIERCISHVPDACRDCSYYDLYEFDGYPIDCMERLLEDSLELLRISEAAQKRREENGAFD